MELLEVDGSQGEGGGQILRTALSFSAILRRPVRVTKVRAGRETPGLKRQHLAALNTLAEVFGGELRGAEVGSMDVSFFPGDAAKRSLRVETGTAASITLILQAVIPAAGLSGSSLTLDLGGGTDVPWSPTFDYLTEVVRPAFSKIGIEFEAEAVTRGYYPRGGGLVKATIHPSEGLKPAELQGQEGLAPVRIISRIAGLPHHVGERQLRSASQAVAARSIPIGEQTSTEEQALSPGSSVLLSTIGEGRFIGADSIGAKGKPAEAVGSEAAAAFVSDLSTGAAVDSHLADMVVPLLSLAPSGSVVRVPRLTPHLSSSLTVARQFTGCDYETVEGEGSVLLRMSPRPGKTKLPGHNV